MNKQVKWNESGAYRIIVESDALSIIQLLSDNNFYYCESNIQF